MHGVTMKMVCHNSFCQLGNGVSLRWVIWHEAYIVHCIMNVLVTNKWDVTPFYISSFSDHFMCQSFMYISPIPVFAVDVSENIQHLSNIYCTERAIRMIVWYCACCKELKIWGRTVSFKHSLLCARNKCMVCMRLEMKAVSRSRVRNSYHALHFCAWGCVQLSEYNRLLTLKVINTFQYDRIFMLYEVRVWKGHNILLFFFFFFYVWVSVHHKSI